MVTPKRGRGVSENTILLNLAPPLFSPLACCRYRTDAGEIPVAGITFKGQSGSLAMTVVP